MLCFVDVSYVVLDVSFGRLRFVDVVLDCLVAGLSIEIVL